MTCRIWHHISNGLTTDAKMLCHFFPHMQVISYPEINVLKESPLCIGRTDIHIFLEHIYESALSFANTNIFIPNMEFLNNKDLNLLRHYPDIMIVAKTKYAMSILDKAFGSDRVHYTGWHSLDIYNQNVIKCNQWIHLKGTSPFKHTQTVLNVWLKHPEWPMLNVIAHGDVKKNGFIEIHHPVNIATNITLYQYKMNSNELVCIMNKCNYHLCPSRVEGFGHYINEALSTDATVITTDGAPMNELITDRKCLIPCKSSHMMNFANSFELSEQDLERILKNIIINHMQSSNTRQAFINRGVDFANLFATLIALCT